MVHNGSTLARCAEDIINEVDATIVFVNFRDETHQPDHELLFRTYNLTYINMLNTTMYDGMHPDLESMNNMSLGLIALLQKGVNAQEVNPHPNSNQKLQFEFV
eukprot:UN01938